MNESRDIEEQNGFRVNPTTGFEHGKWFATSFDDAVRWGKAMQGFSRSRPFRIAAVFLPTSLLGDLEFHPALDGIGPAFFARHDVLVRLGRSARISVSAETYEAEPQR